MNDEPGTGELTADELKALKKETIRRDRISLFEAVHDDMAAIAKALQDLPFKDAESPLAKCQAVIDVILDEVGDHMGKCEFCDEHVFLSGQDDPLDDCESTEDLGWVHRSCINKLRETNPEMFRAPDDEGED